jgi:mono/diheme cytochrome c family protein
MPDDPNGPAASGLAADADEQAWYWWWLTPKRLAVAVLIAFLAIQLIPVWLLETNPATRADPAWDSVRTASLVHRACYDCHSNATTWPWYSRVAPVSWLTVYDVVSARNRLNFSQFTSKGPYPGAASDAAEAISSGDMPPSYYLWMHPTASLNATEKTQLIAGLIKSLP